MKLEGSASSLRTDEKRQRHTFGFQKWVVTVLADFASQKPKGNPHRKSVKAQKSKVAKAAHVYLFISPRLNCVIAVDHAGRFLTSSSEIMLGRALNRSFPLF